MRGERDYTAVVAVALIAATALVFFSLGGGWR